MDKKNTKTTIQKTSGKTKVKFNNITKIFGKLIANNNINFEVKENEIHALLGENGAGKSTLMSILFGLYIPSSGSIEINNQVVKIKDPRHANELKIAMLPQHFKLVENMSVFENVTLGYEKLHGNSVKERKEYLENLAKQFNLVIDINAVVEKLSIVDMQKVEILKILWRDAEIIIFDEPTSILTPQEISAFLEMVQYMKKIGKTILLITHKLPEIRAVADRVTIIRKGKFIATKTVKNVQDKTLAELMVGKSVDLNLKSIKRIKHPANKSKNVLEIKDLHFKGGEYQTTLKKINLNIKRGEIVGIAAIDGNGQSELVKIIAGLNKATTGKIKLQGAEIQNHNIHERYFNFKEQKNMDPNSKAAFNNAILKIKKELKATKQELMFAKYQKDDLKIEALLAKIHNLKIELILAKKPKTLISHIPEDRHEFGLILDYTVAKNVVLQDINFFSRFGFLLNKDINARTQYVINKYDVRGANNLDILARSLSGGNQQKLILGREIERQPKLLLAAHPTRGLDVGAIRNVYENIIEARNKGMSVLLLSGELDEIMQVSDRIIVMKDGEIVSTSQGGELSKFALGSLMAGGAS